MRKHVYHEAMKHVGPMSFAAVFVLLVLVSLPTVAPASAKTPKPDDFVRKATIGGLFEVESGKVALKRTTNEDVKQFAHMMVDDHQRIAQSLQSAAEKSSVNHNEIAKDLDGAHLGKIQNLQSASEAGFNRAYAKEQVDAHKEAVDLFTKYSESGADPALKEFAGRTLPTLKQHQQAAQELLKDVSEPSRMSD